MAIAIEKLLMTIRRLVGTVRSVVSTSLDLGGTHQSVLQ
jgi:hypothetical protein